MSNRATKTPSIPNPSKENLLDAVGSIKDLLDVREGRSGDPLDANVTYRDLKELGLADLPEALKDLAGSIPGGGQPVVVPPWINPVPWNGENYDPTTDLSTPPTPTNLVATGSYSAINLTWAYASYRNHAYTEVYRSAVDDLGTAVLIGVNQAPLFSDPVGTEKAFYYWVRNVSMANVKSEFNSASGAYAATALDVERRIREVEKRVLDDSLARSLQTRIARIEASRYATDVDLTSVRQDVETIRDVIGNDVANVRSALFSSIGIQGSNIIELQTITTNQASRIVALGTRMNNAESSIVNIQKTTANQAYSVTGLQSVVYDPTTGLEATRATLLSSYYTKAETDSAIATADLALQTSINNTLTGYVTTANLTANYYTKSQTDASIANANLALETSFNNTLTGYVTTSSLTTNYYTKSQTDSAIANADLTLNTSFNNTLANYTTTANLVANYYTKTDADFALTQMSFDLTSKFNKTLQGYATTAYVSSFAYAKAAVDYAIATSSNTLEASISNVSASVTTLEQTKIGYATLNSTGLAFDNNGAIKDKEDVDAWNLANPSNQATWNVGLPFVTAVKQVAVSDGFSSLTLEQRFTAQKTTNSNLEGQYTVKIDNNGFMAGFGLASTARDGTPFSSFMVAANRFAVINPAGTKYDITSLTRSGSTATLVYDGPSNIFTVGQTITVTNVSSEYWNGVFTVASVSGTTITFEIIGPATTPATAMEDRTMTVSTATVPFVVEDGITYINSAAILDASIDTAKIANLSADKIVTGNLTATLRVTTGEVASAPFGQAGFFLGNDGGTQKLYVGNGVNKYLQWDGNNLSVRGTIFAENGSFNGYIFSNFGLIGGCVLSDSSISGNYVAGASGWAIKSDGTAEFDAASIRGLITASQIDSRGLSIKDPAGNIILASGTPLTGANIAFGYGVNVIPNADFIDGIGTLTLGFENMSGTPTIGINATSKRVSGESTAFLSYGGATASGQLMGADVKNGPNTYFSVTPGSRYEFSGYLNVDRCIGYLTLSWYDANGTYISEVNSDSTTTTGDFTSLAGMTRVSGFATAPANAVRALFTVRGQSTGVASPVVYFSRLYFGLASASQTELSLWAPGRGIAQITPTNASTYIASLAVDTLQIAGNAATVPVALNQSSTVSWFGAPTVAANEWSGDGSVLFWKDVVAAIGVNFGTVNTTNKCLLGFSYETDSYGGGSDWYSAWRIVRDDSTIIKSGNFGVANNTGGPTITGIAFDNDTGNGIRYYKLQVAIWGGIGAAWNGTADVARNVFNGTLFGMGAKR